MAQSLRTLNIKSFKNRPHCEKLNIKTELLKISPVLPSQDINRDVSWYETQSSKSTKPAKMKFDPRVLFLITAIVCLVFVIKTFIDGGEYDGSFWMAVGWVFMGGFLYKYPLSKDDNKH